MACGLGTILPALLPSPVSCDALDALLAALPALVITPLPELANPYGISLCSTDRGRDHAPVDGDDESLVPTSRRSPSKAVKSDSALAQLPPAGSRKACSSRSGALSEAGSVQGPAGVPAAVVRGLRGTGAATAAGSPATPTSGADAVAGPAGPSSEEWLALLRKPARAATEPAALAALATIVGAVLVHEKREEWERDELLLTHTGYRYAITLQ
jgi:hypothetical protein